MIKFSRKYSQFDIFIPQSHFIDIFMYLLIDIYDNIFMT